MVLYEKTDEFDHLCEVLDLAVSVLTRYEKEKRRLKPLEKTLLEQMNRIHKRFEEKEQNCVSNLKKEKQPFRGSPALSLRSNVTGESAAAEITAPKKSTVENKKGISTIKTMITSSKLMKEIMLRDEESRNLVEFAAQCTKATSKGRSELCMVIVEGIGALLGDFLPAKTENGNDINVSHVKIRIFLHRKSFDVLEDPINKEIIKFEKPRFTLSARNMKRHSICTPMEFAGVGDSDNIDFDGDSTNTFLTPNEPELSLNPLYDNAVKRCFESLRPTECVEENSLFFPLVYEGHIC
eukprot:Tbor_TRINITY_DN4927_c0_g1::TRINITY_DN4927_c0_g1_i3::g.9922::m.9922